LFKKLKEAVKKLHSYEVCEIISLPIEEGNEDYLKWINLQTF
jgi:periplasmic divalent cation tolerance protein